MHLRQFCLQLFQHCPLLSGFTSEQHLAAYEEFLAYKVRVPVRGAILLDESMERVVLVKGWKKGASWSFPRGKINKDEKDIDCTVREVWEETGFDIRAAGLVPENERDVKFIDITMREQHMRMFVFRDVPLDTFFEPKTRKEISKIQWYNLRDLPGFARKNRNDGDSGNANKFYMVAPFMSHVKKWIGQQRRKEEAVVQTEEQMVAHGLDVEQAVNEELEPYEPVQPPTAPVDRSDELKRLLSIGGPGAAPAPAQQVPQQPQTTHANHLLAMLQGGAQGHQNGLPPQTPMDQVNAFIPTQPDSPHPRHPRQPPMGYQPPPPQFPLSPPRVPQHSQQGSAPLPPPGFVQPHPYHGTFGSNRAPPQVHPQATQGAHGMHQGQPFAQPSGIFNHGSMHSPLPSAPPQPNQAPRQASMPDQYQLQGQHGVIASGPSAPNPSQLPPPRLTAQHMKLLDAFKTKQTPVQQTAGSGAAPRSGSVHQSALLGLFKTAPATEASSSLADPRSEQAVVSPGPDEIVQRPAELQERRPTLNEITRSLPLNFKAKRPSQHSPAIPQQMTPPISQPSQQPPQPAARQPAPATQLEPSATEQQPASIPHPQSQVDNPKTRANKPKEPKAKEAPAPSAKQILQRPASRQPTGRGQRDKSAVSPSPGRQSKPKANEPQAPFTILTRPGSARGKSGSPASGSPKQAFQPQLLRRHDGADAASAPTNGHAEPSDGVSSGDGSGKRDQLLALFSKSPAASHAPPQESPAARSVSPPSAAVSPPVPASSQNNHLLNLFNAPAPGQNQQRSPQPSPQPPAAPSLQPTHRPNKPKTPVPPPIASHPPQNALLDLFKKPAHAHSPSVESPISPFNLSSPHGMRHGQLPGKPAEQPRSRLGSVASGSGNATPTEQKDFLLGFLNGVVQKEGQRK